MQKDKDAKEAKDVKEDAKAGAKDVKEDAKAEAKDVKEDAKAEAKDVKEDVKAEAKNVKEDVKEDAKGAKGTKAEEVKELLAEISKATGVSETDALKVLDHLGLGEKLKELEAHGAKAKTLGTADVKIAIKVGKSIIAI